MRLTPPACALRATEPSRAECRRSAPHRRRTLAPVRSGPLLQMRVQQVRQAIPCQKHLAFGHAGCHSRILCTQTRRYRLSRIVVVADRGHINFDLASSKLSSTHFAGSASAALAGFLLLSNWSPVAVIWAIVGPPPSSPSQ